MSHPMFTVSNQMEEFISIQMDNELSDKKPAFLFTKPEGSAMGTSLGLKNQTKPL